MITLKIRRAVLERLHEHARRAGRNECMGLLACRQQAPPGNVTAHCRLRAEASPGHAEANPEVVLRAAQRFHDRHLRPVGLWHSHGLHDVYHSHTDDTTIVRLLPAMAEWNFERPPLPLSTPAITAPDSAVLPLADGQLLRCTLLGPQIPGLDAHECVQWQRIATRFARADSKPRMTQKGRTLILKGDRVILRLEVPEGASLVTCVEDLAPYRRAQLFSIVVNQQGDTFAEALVVHDVEGETLLEKKPCEIEIIGASEEALEEQPSEAEAEAEKSQESRVESPEPEREACCLPTLDSQLSTLDSGEQS
jgi:proteasome lid subunit RPN8/RPN11